MPNEFILPFVKQIVDQMRPEQMPMAVFIDSLLLEVPDMIENRAKLSSPVAVVRSYGHLDEYMEITRQSEDDAARRAQERLDRKRREFAHVEHAVSFLRDAIREYYRKTSI